MIFRLSQTLNTKIKAGALRTMPLEENPYADWSARLFTVDRTQYILLSNTKSLYSAVMYGKGITNDSQFIERALSSIREFMQDDGQQFAFHRFIAPASATVTFAKALNKSVTGCMNELVFQAVIGLVGSELAPHDVDFRLNDTLISSLPGPDGRGYGKPREAFTKLLTAAPAP
jgi:hypothetical protein